MKKPIRPIFWALSTFILASTFCIYRVNSQEVPPPNNAAPLKPETQAQRERRKEFQGDWKKAKEQSYRARLHNDSKRGGVRLEELPEKFRREAQSASQQYQEEIYPSLKKYIAAHNGQLPEAAFALPEFTRFMQDTQYKGVGAPSYGRGSWSIGVSYRMDGTVVSRDVYSNAPSDEPHDIWANLNKFANYPSTGKGFVINGWDDGRVTFDLVERNYYGTGTVFGRQLPGAAVPGQAGIPPEFKQGLKTWFKKLDKDIQNAKSTQKNKIESSQTEDNIPSLPEQVKN